MLLLQHYSPRNASDIGINVIDDKHLSLLHHAAKNDDIEVIETIITQNKSGQYGVGLLHKCNNKDTY